MRKGDSQTFSYTGNVQEFTIPNTGLYKLEVWGAQGGAYGGYSIGYKVLNAGTKIYVVVGGKGSEISPFVQTGSNPGGYNGGGNGYNVSYGEDNDQKRFGGGGGGATHIALVTGTLSSIGKTDFVTNGKGLIVAGGGGGNTINYYGNRSYSGGSGGGTNGGANQGGGSAGGTQSSGFAFGQGGSTSGEYGGGGGGGFYGGRGRSGGDSNTPGSGGSGWIDGVPEITYQGETYTPSTINGQRSGNGEAKLTLMSGGGVKYGEKDVTVYYGTKLVSVYYGDKQL